MTLYQDCLSRHDLSGNMTASGRGLLSPVYLYKNLYKKNVLVINQWMDFNKTWQEHFFVDPPPRLLKPS